MRVARHPAGTHLQESRSTPEGAGRDPDVVTNRRHPPRAVCRDGIRRACAIAALAPALASAQAADDGASTPPGRPDRPLVHQSWGIEDGLPLSHVNAVLATRQGYLWLATYDGLVRFDGATFEIFNASTRPELPTSRFVTLHEDHEGGLWSSAEFDHVIRFRQGRFETYSLPESALGGAIGGMRIGRDGTAWVSTNRGLFRVEEDRLVAVPGTERVALSRAPYEAVDGAIWLITDGRGALRWAGDSLVAFGDPSTQNGRVARGFFDARDGRMYGATGTGVFEYRDGTAHWLPLPLESSTILDLVSLSADSAFVVTDGGVMALADGAITIVDRDMTSAGGRAHVVRDGRGDRWLAINRRLYRNHDLVYESDLSILGLAADHEGSVWVAADGLHRFKPSLFDVRGRPEVAFSNVYPIFEDSRQRVWIGGLGGGVGWFDESGFHEAIPDFSSLPQAIAEGADGRIWVGTINYGGCVTDAVRCPPDGRFLAGHTIKALYPDRSGTMWIGTDRGVYRESPGEWAHLSMEDGLPHDFVRVIRQTADGAMWFGTNGGGVARYREGTIETLSTASGFPSDLVRAIHEVSPGILLFGTEDAGLVFLQVESGAPLSNARVLALDRGVGLYDDGVHSIVPDDFGRLWMNTNRGIFWVRESEVMAFASGDASRVRSVAYRESDGLWNPEGNGGVQSAAIKGSDGRLWFAMQAGVAIVDPRDVEGAEYALPVLVENLRVEGGRSISAESSEGATIVLDPHERSFEVDYTALGFLTPGNLRFQYRLSDFQSNWVDAANRRTAFFTNVPPGEYEFEVRATREDGVWRELEAPLPISVRTYFHETPLFRFSVVTALLLLGFAGLSARERTRLAREQRLEGLVSERTATIEAQAAQLEEMDRAKSRFFANISHEFRTPLTLTIGPLEDLVSGQHGELDADRLEPVRLSLRNSRRLLKLVNQLMDVAKLEARAVEVRAQERDVVPFVRDLVQAFAPLAERDGIETTVRTPDHPVPLVFDPDLLERVILNLLSNAFKFTPEGGHVAIEVAEPEAGWATVAVRDSGPGIAEDQVPHLFERFYQGDASQSAPQPGTGIGLSLARELTVLHGGRLEVESDLGFGSTFTIWMRVGADHLAPDQIVEPVAPRAGLGPLVEEELALLETARRPEADQPRPYQPARKGVSEEEPTDDVPTVLIVEDNVDVAAFIRGHLDKQFRCVEARDGREALELTRRHLPDVVVSDVMMPRMDGMELLRALRADPDLAYVPVLLLTAKAGQEHKLEGLEAGAAAYLTKPFDRAELEARIGGLIAQQRRLRDRFRREALLNPAPPEIESREDRFLVKLRDTIEAHLADDDFDVRALARAMSESRSSLYRHVHDLVGETPSALLKRVRLERAEAMLAAGAGSIQEIAYAVGFKSVSHFSRSFKEHTGVPPSRYAEREDSGPIS